MVTPISYTFLLLPFKREKPAANLRKIGNILYKLDATVQICDIKSGEVTAACGVNER